MTEIEQEIYKLTLSNKGWTLNCLLNSLYHRPTRLRCFYWSNPNGRYGYHVSTRINRSFNISDESLNKKLREIHLILQKEEEEREEKALLESLKAPKSW